MYPKDRTAHLDALAHVATHLVLARRDEKLLADKLHAGDVSRRHAHAACDFALRADAQHHGLAVKRLPHVALDVDPQAVGLRVALVLVEDALVRHGARGRVVGKGKDLARGRVRKVHGLAVRGPADAIGDGELVQDLGLGAFAEVEERSYTLC